MQKLRKPEYDPTTYTISTNNRSFTSKTNEFKIEKKISIKDMFLHKRHGVSSENI
jgi:hypothetical protein